MSLTLENGAKCAVLVELFAGVGNKYNSFIMLTIGTGIGGGIMLEGTLCSIKSGQTVRI